MVDGEGPNPLRAVPTLEKTVLSYIAKAKCVSLEKQASKEQSSMILPLASLGDLELLILRLYLQSAGITSRHHHVWIMQC